MASRDPSSPSLWAPFRIGPVFVSRVWGYHDLRPWFDHIAQEEPTGEVWLTGGNCTAATGEHAGRTLENLFHEAPEHMLGGAAPSPASPLLIKVLFAREKLSVQVHPDDRLAQKYGQPRGKTECWYALAADPGAQVAVGVRPGVSLREIEQQIHAGTLESSLELLPVARGDMIFVDAGTVHAIWPGSILLEVQQNCDITYRLYDYGRRRELHIEKGLEAVRLATRAGKIARQQLNGRSVLIDVEYFRMEHVPIQDQIASDALSAATSPGYAPGLSYLFAAEGTARITGADFDPVDLPARAIVCVPASSPRFILENLGGLDLIRITPRWPAHG